eukprot:Rmarinus@m.25450
MSSLEARTREIQEKWEAMQQKTFVAWANSHLQKRDKMYEIKELPDDLKDGVLVVILLELLINKKAPRYSMMPKLRVQKLENVSIAVSFASNNGVKLDLEPSNVVDGDVKYILGMLWTLIRHFQFQELEAEASTADDTAEHEADAHVSKKRSKAEAFLLSWCQRMTVDVKDVSISNFSSSFEDGKAFVALLHAIRPEEVQLDTMLSEEYTPEERLATVFELAEDVLQITPLLDPEDFMAGAIDERSVMTYVSMYYNAQKALQMAETNRALAASEKEAVARKAEENISMLEQARQRGEAEVGTLKQKIQVLEDELRRARAKLVQVAFLDKKYKRRMDEMQNSLNHVADERTKLQIKLSNATQALESKESEALSLADRLQAEQERSAAVAAAKKVLLDEKTELAEREASLQSQCRQLEHTVEQKNEEIADMRRRREEEAMAREEMTADANATVSAERCRAQAAESECERLRASLGEARSENVSLSENLRRMTAMHEQESAQVSSLQSSLQETSAHVSELEGLLQAARVKQSETHTELETSKMMYERSQQRVGQLEEAKAELQAELQKSSDLVEDLQHSISEMKNQLDKTEEVLSVAVPEKEKVEEELRHTTTECEELRVQVYKAFKDNEDLTVKMTKMVQEGLHGQTEIEAKQSEIEAERRKMIAETKKSMLEAIEADKEEQRRRSTWFSFGRTPMASRRSSVIAQAGMVSGDMQGLMKRLSRGDVVKEGWYVMFGDQLNAYKLTGPAHAQQQPSIASTAYKTYPLDRYKDILVTASGFELLPHDDQKIKAEVFMVDDKEARMKWVLSIGGQIHLAEYKQAMKLRGQAADERVTRFVKDPEAMILSIDKCTDVSEMVSAIGFMVHHSMTLRTLKLTRIAFDDVSFTLLARTMGANRTITDLFLTSNHLQPHHVKVLCSALSGHRSLVGLHLNDNKLGDEGVKIVASQLLSSAEGCLDIVDFSQNLIGDEGALALTEVLSPKDDQKVPKRFPRLDFGHNKIADAGAIALAELCNVNPSVTVFNLSSNIISDEGAIAIGRMLETNTTVREVDLSSNAIAKKGAKAISDALRTNITLEVINLGDNITLGRAAVIGLLDQEGCAFSFPALKLSRAFDETREDLPANAAGRRKSIAKRGRRSISHDTLDLVSTGPSVEEMTRDDSVGSQTLKRAETAI